MGEPERAPPRMRRRTQQERRTATREALLQATLDCIQRLGYGGASIAEIASAACMSRGAVLHHFPTKADLIAAAMVGLYRQRLVRFGQAMADTPADQRSLSDRLEVIWDEVQAWFPVTLEFMLAMRTDTELRAAFDSRIGEEMGAMQQGYATLVPELRDEAASVEIQYVIGCFLRGLCLESIVNEPRVVRSILERFSAMLQAYVTSVEPAAGGAAGQ
jgi:AcrR family transcriptional regulator